MPDAGPSRTDHLPLHHSWPLEERAQQFYLGCIVERDLGGIAPLADEPHIARHAAGWWECDLTDESLSWSSAVYDIFGVPRGAKVTRGEAVGFYSEDSRATMERLRSHAIEHRCGFTLDAQIRRATGEVRWMRLMAAPICHEGRTVRLHGLKLIL